MAAMLALLACAAGVAVYLVLVQNRGADQRAVVSAYLRAWSREDFPAMYRLLDPASQRRTSLAAFASDYRRAADTATLIGVRSLRVGRLHGQLVTVSVLAHTRLFGDLREALPVSVLSAGDAVHVRFASSLVFPGLRAGEHLTRTTVMPPRAALLALDGTPLAEGPDRSSPIPDVASAIAGRLGPIPPGQGSEMTAAGYPPDAKVGLSGLERIFERRLAGTPGGTLLAGPRELARRPAVPAATLKTTIDPTVERSILTAMGARYAGVVALDPRTGAVLGAAGIGFSGLQPPGSTMKIVTTTAALEAGIVKLGDVFQVRTEATIDGFALQNAGGEACGGTLLNAFAVSCNSVFAPIGVKLGPSRFLATARRFGFDGPPLLPGEPAGSIPPGDIRAGGLELGASAIGQGKVQATALQMADIAATIAMGGRRPLPTLVAGRPPAFVPVTTPSVAAQVQRMMIAVVEFGTGTAAQISGVTVAGKTGTAELRNTANPNDPNASNPANTDAWFVGYAPAQAPRIVVGALFPGQGAGGQTAAPAVREVLIAGLQRR